MLFMLIECDTAFIFGSHPLILVTGIRLCDMSFSEYKGRHRLHWNKAEPQTALQCHCQCVTVTDTVSVLVVT